MSSWNQCFWLQWWRSPDVSDIKRVIPDVIYWRTPMWKICCRLKQFRSANKRSENTCPLAAPVEMTEPLQSILEISFILVEQDVEVRSEASRWSCKWKIQPELHQETKQPDSYEHFNTINVSFGIGSVIFSLFQVCETSSKTSQYNQRGKKYSDP